MAQDLNQIITFIEQYSIDERVYVKVPQFDKPDQFVEVIWERGAPSRSWKIRRASQLGWHHCTADDTLLFLKESKADMRLFEKALRDAVVSQAIYADYYLRQAGKTVGEAKIQKAKEQTDSFLSSLSQVLHRQAVQTKHQAASPTLQSGKRSTRHLQLIKSDDRRKSE